MPHQEMPHKQFKKKAWGKASTCLILQNAYNRKSI